MSRIVLLEPTRDVRESLRNQLRKRSGVIAVGKVQEALQAIDRAEPSAVVIALDLGPASDMHGLKFAKLVREARGGNVMDLLVYGVPVGKSPSPAKVIQLEESYETDHYIAANLPTAELAAEIFKRLQLEQPSRVSPNRWWKRSKPIMETFDAEDTGNFSMRDVLDSSSVVTARAAVSDPDMDSWSEVLNEDVSLKNIRRAMTKAATFKQVNGFADDQNPTWTELLRSPASPQIIKTFLTKEIRFSRD